MNKLKEGFEIREILPGEYMEAARIEVLIRICGVLDYCAMDGIMEPFLGQKR